MPQSYWNNVITEVPVSYHRLFLALENQAHKHVYRPLPDHTLDQAENAAIDALLSDTNVIIVYVYPAYCPICAPDIVDDCGHELLPATQLDYVAKYEQKPMSRYAS